MFAWYVLYREGLLFATVMVGLLVAEALERGEGLRDGWRDLKERDVRRALVISIVVTFIQFLAYVIFP